MKPWFWMLAVSWGCGLSATPEEAPPPPGSLKGDHDVLVRGGGVHVTEREAAVLYERLGVPVGERPRFHLTDDGRRLLGEYLVSIVLYEQALADERWNDPVVANRLAFAQRQVLASTQRDALAARAVTQDAIDEWKGRYEPMFSKPQVRARQVVFKREDRAKQALTQLRDGANFEAIAASQGLNKASEDLGWQQVGQHGALKPEVFSSEALGFFGPFETPYGFHVIEVVERRDRTPAEEVERQARADLEHSEAERLIEAMGRDMDLEWVVRDAP